MTRIGLVFGGRSVEHEVSVRSARAVAAALGEAGHEVVPLGIGEDGVWVDRERAAAALDRRRDVLGPGGGPVAPSLARLIEDPPEVVFPLVHGTWGEDGTLQGLCEMLDLPYVGAGVTASALAMDKVAAKRVLAAAGVPVVEYWAARREEVEADPRAVEAALPGYEGPFFVKPSVGGSSVGVRKVGRRDGLAEAIRFALRFDDAVLVERGIEGRELECAVLGGLEIEASAVGEIVPGSDFYDYQDKYHSDQAKLFAPADLPEATADRLRALAVEAFRALGGTGMARVDFLLEGDGRPWVNEINTLPGFTAISMYPKLWQVSGVPLPELADRLVKLAVERHRERRRLDEGIKDFLANLS
jgi:D-alanine-D-alanine ligase